jgi:hypothetical protein
MTSNFRLLRPVAASVAVITLVAVAAAMAIGIAHPEPVSSGALGPDWQCTRLALVFTSCTPIVRIKTAAAAAKAPVCPRPAAWRNAFRFLLGQKSAD